MKKIFLLIVLAFSLSINAQEKTSNDFKKTDEVLSEIVKKSLIIAEKTGDFVIEQAPMLLKEFYAWHIWSDIFFILLGATFIVFGIKIPYLWLDEEESNWDYKYFKRYGYEGVVAAWVSYGVGMVIGIIMIFFNVYDLVYIIVAPKLYLIDYFIK